MELIKKIFFREARLEDLPNIVHLLSDDSLGQFREDSSIMEPYEEAMKDILRDPNNTVWIAELSHSTVGVFQLTFIPNLTFQGGLRAQIEGLRTKKNIRGHGVGSAIINHAIELSRKRGCRMLQLTSNSTRLEAIKFYEELGFEATHVGFKMYLNSSEKH